MILHHIVDHIVFFIGAVPGSVPEEFHLTLEFIASKKPAIIDLHFSGVNIWVAQRHPGEKPLVMCPGKITKYNQLEELEELTRLNGLLNFRVGFKPCPILIVHPTSIARI